MSLIDELRAAAEEYATEATITQEAWSAALVEGWLKCCSIGWALTKAANIQGIGVAPHVWDRLLEQTEQLTPRLSRYTNLKGDLRPWIANNAVHANDALWDGRIEDAVRLMRKGGVRKDGQKSNRREALAEIRSAQISGLRVGGRNSDKRHDWKTVK